MKVSQRERGDGGARGGGGREGGAAVPICINNVFKCKQMSVRCTEVGEALIVVLVLAVLAVVVIIVVLCTNGEL